jgi:hypothetical protein
MDRSDFDVGSLRENLATSTRVQRSAAAARTSGVVKMEKMGRLDIHKLMERYVGSSGGYLGSFGSHQDLLRFYIDCGMDVIPTDFPGTNKDRFQAILESAEPRGQAKIIRGILKRHTVGSSPDRTQQLHDELIRLAQRLETGAGVTNPSPVYTSEFVRRTLSEVEHAVTSERETGGVDRIHSAMHGYLQAVCRAAGISFSDGARVDELFSVIRARHPAFSRTAPRAAETTAICRAMAQVLVVLNPIRNDGSMAHPTEQLIEPIEATLVINAVRTILHYVDAKLAAVA